MPVFTDEQLMAWVDGELPPAEARALAAAVEADPALAARVRPFRESRRILQDTFAAQLQAPVPRRLLEALAAPAPRTRRWRQQVPLALAASVALAVGIVVGLGLGPRGGHGGALAVLAADAASLDRALETLPAGEVLQGEHRGTRFEILPLGTLRTASGTWCRDFETTVPLADGRQHSRGVACRVDGHWEVKAVARLDVNPAPAGDDAYHAAGAAGIDPAGVLGSAERLTPEQEHARIAARWAN